MLLMWFMLYWTCSSLVQANQPKACQLYTVNDGEKTWNLPRENTIITLEPTIIKGKKNENAKVSKPSFSKLDVGDLCLVKIKYKEEVDDEVEHNEEVDDEVKHKEEVNDDLCLVKINHKEEVDDNVFPSYTSNEESDDVVLRVTDDQVWVSHMGTKEWKNATIPGNTITITSDGTVNVAFNCPERCFQFDKATTIAKSLPELGNDTLTFYGRPTNTTSQFGNIHLLRGQSSSWTQQAELKLASVQPDTQKWLTFVITGQKIGECQRSDNITYQFSIEGDIIPNKANCMPASYLILQFDETSNMEWALCMPPGGRTGVTQNSSNNSNYNPTCPNVVKSTQVLYWWCVGGGGVVVCVLLVTLVVTCVMHYRFRKQHSTINKNTNTASIIPSNTQQEDASNAEDHIYETVELSQVREEGNNRSQNRVYSVNSLYGYVSTNDQPSNNREGSVNSLYGYVIQSRE